MTLLTNDCGAGRGKRKIKIIAALLIIFFIVSAGFAAAQPKKESENPVVRMKTSLGTIDIELYEDSAPKTVDNFIGLVKGTKEFTDPETGEKDKRRFYDGLTFHRVIDGFMIQSGDPLGTGRGGPGYTFEDEINADSLGLDEMKVITEEGYTHQWLMVQSQEDFDRYILAPLFHAMGIKSKEDLEERQEEVQKRLNKLTLKEVYENMGYQYRTDIESYPPERGSIAMANSGPGSNGSQFFINLVDTPWLTGKHTVFGQVIDGMDVVSEIGKQETGENNKPVEEIKIISMRMIE